MNVDQQPTGTVRCKQSTIGTRESNFWGGKKGDLIWTQRGYIYRVIVAPVNSDNLIYVSN